MANVNVPSIVEIELDRPRRMRLTLGAMAAIERRTGISFLNGSAFRLADLSIETVIALLTEALRWDDPDITDEVVGSNIDMGSFTSYIDAFGELAQGSAPRPDPTPAATGETPPNVVSIPTNGTGSKRGPSADMTSD